MKNYFEPMAIKCDIEDDSHNKKMYEQILNQPFLNLNPNVHLHEARIIEYDFYDKCYYPVKALSFTLQYNEELDEDIYKYIFNRLPVNCYTSSVARYKNGNNWVKHNGFTAYVKGNLEEITKIMCNRAHLIENIKSIIITELSDDVIKITGYDMFQLTQNEYKKNICSALCALCILKKISFYECSYFLL